MHSTLGSLLLLLVQLFVSLIGTSNVEILTSPNYKFVLLSWASDSILPDKKNGGRLHHLTETVSNSGVTVRKRRWRLMGVLNTEATRDPQKDDNKVKNLLSMVIDIFF